MAGGGTVELIYKTLKPREIVCGRRGTPRRTIFCIHASNANAVTQTTGVGSAIMRSPGLNIQGIEYTQMRDRPVADRPSGA
jgi:hypothetical protein